MVRLHGSYPGAVRFPVHGGAGDGAMFREPNHNHSHNQSQRACGWAAGAMDVRVGACVEWRGGVDGSVMAVMCVCGEWPVRIHPFRFSVRFFLLDTIRHFLMFCEFLTLSLKSQHGN